MIRTALVARLNHPRIVSLTDSGEGDRLRYYIILFVAGDTLRSRSQSC